jgi:hypothetical protein
MFLLPQSVTLLSDVSTVYYDYDITKRLRRGFELVIGCINNLQVVTTINYYTIAALHNLQSLHTNLFSLSAPVFTDLYHGNYNSLTESHTTNITYK